MANNVGEYMFEQGLIVLPCQVCLFPVKIKRMKIRKGTKSVAYKCPLINKHISIRDYAGYKKHCKLVRDVMGNYVHPASRKVGLVTLKDYNTKKEDNNGTVSK